ncbi:transmembrane protein 168 isoform X1 [Alosa sapidissima]|uniref:transmembrane protein 168 isoform X1 n=1 Tax=Alosa sapidissima TaxID=34773 RepID=UPI001C09CFBF|nr:transmembrane protein 168 isoform X1 [Alosa sapidissima]
MCRLLKYCISHCLYAAVTRFKEVVKDVSMWTSVRCLGYLSNLSLFVAICLGLYARWERTAESIVLVILILGLFVLGIASIFYYYFSMEGVSLSLFHIWFGFLLGLLCFLNNPSPEIDVKEEATNYLLVASVVIFTMWALLERICGNTKPNFIFLTSYEVLELTGFTVASTILLIDKSACVGVLSVALGVLLVALRTKSFLALPNTICFVAINATVFFKSLNMSTNPFALACFFVRLVCQPLLDVYFSGQSAMERWQPLLLRAGLWRRLSLLPLLAVEVAFFVLAAVKLGHLDLWYLLIPGFFIFGLFWVICHVVLIVTLWGFHSKLSDCQRVLSGQRSDMSSLDRVMASKGMRHFCLISQRLVIFSVVSTIILGALSWQPSNSLYISLLLLVLPLESLAHGLFHELGSCLGGTSVGYAVVIPTNYCSPDGQPILLPPDQVQALNLRSTAMLNHAQRFFSHHMIDTFGCDYSTSGLTLQGLQAKLCAFLESTTADGPRHDTYVVFYSGHTHYSGDWALAGGETLRLEEILAFWREKNTGSCSRLILVLDTENSLPWVKAARRVEDVYVAVQGAELTHSSDVEVQNAPQLGDFTAEWVEFNCNPGSAIRWTERGRIVKAVYGLSRNWGDYELHLPTGSDVANHWRVNFPRLTYPVVQLAHWSTRLNLFWMCNLFLKCLRKIKLTWFPPAVLDTGQGFKLVKS